MLKPVPLIGGSYTDDSLPYDRQDCVNFIPELAQNQHARSEGILRGAPGLDFVLDLSSQASSVSGYVAKKGPVRGIRNVEGKLFAVQGSSLFQIQNDLSTTFIGNIPGDGRVSMTHNQISNGNQLTIVNGPQGFVYNTAKSTLTTITDDAFIGSSVTGYIDTYTVQLDPMGKFWYVSDSADSTSYNSLNRFDAESAPDIISTLLVDHREVWAFGTSTIEQFVDAGSGNTLFVRQNGTIMQIGIAGPRTAVALDNTVYWLGSDGIVYNAAGGYVPNRVSTFALEQAIQGLNWSKAYAFSWTDRGHKVYYLTFEDGHTWGYDVATQLWHRRESPGLKYWRVNDLVYWNNAWYATDSINGNIYRLNWETYQENGLPLVSTRTTPYASNAENRLFLSEFQVYLNSGRGPVIPDSSINLRYSDDGGYTWSSWKSVSLNRSRNNGDRVLFRRLGSFRDRVFQIEISAAVRRDLIAAYASLESAQ